MLRGKQRGGNRVARKIIKNKYIAVIHQLVEPEVVIRCGWRTVYQPTLVSLWNINNQGKYPKQNLVLSKSSSSSRMLELCTKKPTHVFSYDSFPWKIKCQKRKLRIRIQTILKTSVDTWFLAAMSIIC